MRKVKLIRVQQPTRDCTGCYFLKRDDCPKFCGLGERNEWIIWIEAQFMTHIYTTFDSHNRTWNAMSMDNVCLFYGSIDELEVWLDENKCNYYE